MSDTTTTPPSAGDTSQEQIMGMAEKFFSAAQPGVVFGEPIAKGEYTIITAGEVMAGGGFGYGRGPVPQPEDGSAEAQRQEPMGSGGGGGGGSTGRPVAVIVIGPEGVKIEPVFDLTKIALAGITAWGAMALALIRMNRNSRG